MWLFIILVVFSFSAGGQNTVIQRDSLVKFFYPNGKVSSEGTMRNGKPDGFWKTYYPSGTLKSEGRRKNYELDSIWIFYEDNGDSLEKISYLNGMKNGYFCKYYNAATDSIKTNVVLSKELFVDDVMQGKSYYYNEDGSLHEIIPYKDGRKHGTAKEFSKDGRIITLTRYHNNYQIERERINRTDQRGYKQGMWKEFYPNEKIWIEKNYLNNKLNGSYKEYDEKGVLIQSLVYSNDEIVEENVKIEDMNISFKTEYHPNGTVKYSGSFLDTLPVGMHTEYDEKGRVIRSRQYDENGFLKGEGMVDEEGYKTGEWIFYFPTGEVRSKGKYQKNLMTGEWVYFFLNNAIEQKGGYKDGKLSGTWNWFYESTQIEREEVFIAGKENGLFIEYSPEGNIITKGEYIDGEKEGEWYYHVGDHTEQGNYIGGLRDGIWKHYYSNKKRRFEGKFVQDLPEGRHKYYYDNGKIKSEENYVMGIREGQWRNYDMEGNIISYISYKDNLIVKINGIKAKLPQEEKE